MAAKKKNLTAIPPRVLMGPLLLKESPFPSYKLRCRQGTATRPGGPHNPRGNFFPCSPDGDDGFYGAIASEETPSGAGLRRGWASGADDAGNQVLSGSGSGGPV